MTSDRLALARQSGRSDKDLALLTAQAARQDAERSEASTDFEDKLVRLRAARLAQAAREAAQPVSPPAKRRAVRRTRA